MWDPNHPPEAVHEGLAVQVAPDEHNLVDARLIICPGAVAGAVADGLVHPLEHKLAVAVTLRVLGEVARRGTEVRFEGKQV
jgi:hypothetical protein